MRTTLTLVLAGLLVLTTSAQAKKRFRLKKKPKFKVASALSMKARMKRANIVKILSAGSNNSVPGHAKYKSANGVVVSAGNPEDTATNSMLFVKYSYWSADYKRELLNSPDDYACNIQMHGNRKLFERRASALFNKVSSSKKVYTLTIGTTIPKNVLRVKVNDVIIPNNKLQYSSAEKQYYAFISAKGIKSHSAVHFLRVKVQMKNPGVSEVSHKLHHIQLKQMD